MWSADIIKSGRQINDMTIQLKKEIPTRDGVKQRVTYVDFAKGVTILLVIIGHMSQISIIAKYFICSFRMMASCSGSLGTIFHGAWTWRCLRSFILQQGI